MFYVYVDFTNEEAKIKEQTKNQLISSLLTGRSLSDETKQKLATARSKPVVAVYNNEIIKRFLSAKDAKSFLSCGKSKMLTLLKTNGEYHGFTWYYEEDYNA